MIDTWRIRRVPEGLPGMPSRCYRAAPGWSPGRVHSGHAAQPGASGRVLSFWVLGTRGVLARHPEDSLGVALGVGFSGTRGSLELLPDVVSWFRHSGHVVLSERSREYSLGRLLGMRGTLRS